MCDVEEIHNHSKNMSVKPPQIPQLLLRVISLKDSMTELEFEFTWHYEYPETPSFEPFECQVCQTPVFFSGNFFDQWQTCLDVL